MSPVTAPTLAPTSVAPSGVPAPAAPSAAPRSPVFAPLEGSERVLGTMALALATFMNVLDSSIANVSIPAIAGDLGVSTGTGHLGHHLVCGGQRHRLAVDRLVDAAPGPGAPVHRQRVAVCHRVLVVRPCAEHRIADCVSGAAGFRRRPDDPAVADLVAGQLPTGQGRHRAGDVGHDRAGGTGGRPLAGWLDHRQHLLAVDLLHQRAGRPAGGGNDLVDLPQA